MAALSSSHLDALLPESRALLGGVAERPWGDEVYIAGSAALALYLNHRPVRDIDLMAPANRLTGPERRDLLADLLAGRDMEMALRTGSAAGALAVTVAGAASSIPAPEAVAALLSC